jgi:predicted ribonuclease YlaK
VFLSYIINLCSNESLSSPGEFLIPFDRVSGFVGRINELERVIEMLTDPDGRRLVSIVGLGGVGKSRLALESAYHVKSNFPQYSIFWVQATEQLTFEKGMFDVGKKLSIPGIEDEKVDAKRLVKQWLSN